MRNSFLQAHGQLHHSALLTFFNCSAKWKRILNTIMHHSIMNNKLKLVLFEKLNTLELLKGITLLEYICMMAPQNTWHQTLPLGVCERFLTCQQHRGMGPCSSFSSSDRAVFRPRLEFKLRNSEAKEGGARTGLRYSQSQLQSQGRLTLLDCHSALEVHLGCLAPSLAFYTI